MIIAGMTIAEIVAYTLLFTGGVTILYVVLLAVEQKRGVRFGKRFRQYLDRKVEAAAKRLGKNAAFVNKLYERGVDEVEKDLIDPVTKPIIETQQRYTTLKTGERDLAYTGKKNASPFLREIAEMRRKSKKKKRKKRRRGKGRHSAPPEQRPQQEQAPSEQRPQHQPQQEPQHQSQGSEKTQPEQQSERSHTPQHSEQ